MSILINLNHKLQKRQKKNATGSHHHKQMHINKENVVDKWTSGFTTALIKLDHVVLISMLIMGVRFLLYKVNSKHLYLHSKHLQMHLKSPTSLVNFNC